jgi:LPXTG-site transpeptidase (sortase) family protein
VDIVASPGVSTSLIGGFPAACNPPTNPSVAPEPPGGAVDQGRRIVFSLGNLTNAGVARAPLTIRYRAVVLDAAEVQRGGSFRNQAELRWSAGVLLAQAQAVPVIEPTLTLSKTAAPMSAPPGTPITFTLTLGQDAASDSAAFDLLLTDPIPVGLTYIPGTLTVIGGPPSTTDETGAPTLLVRWDDFGLGETATVQFQATLGNLGAGNGVTNSARLEWTSLPDDPPESLNLSSFNTLATERRYDPATGVDLYGVTASVTVHVPRLPETGFAPGRVTRLDGQSRLMDLGELTLEIPELGVSIPIVGVPADQEGWDLTWLGAQAGYLEGTAYPTHRGNSALTAHVTLPNGRPGPFAALGELRWGDRVVVHAFGMQYVYEVRTVARVTAVDLRPLGHKDQTWLTLITCRTYDEAGGRYLHRIIVQAVLLEVIGE